MSDHGWQNTGTDSDLGAQVVFIGLSLDVAKLTERLDACLLTDDEWADGSDTWTRLVDPYEFAVAPPTGDEAEAAE